MKKCQKENHQKFKSDPVRYSIPDMQYNLICHQRSTKVLKTKTIVPDKWWITNNLQEGT